MTWLELSGYVWMLASIAVIIGSFWNFPGGE